ncbi:hypothetical protein M758_3G022500 [Ceratodon purpureus]|uniref:Uncharacterized protein n=1 Tax=Ceratodon purpureus TaxID=3225 RepID=A0A8T0IGK0_CERPU|nr:hypothetical protein KC19_3G022300 [Ceratodon purpureus]KAG0621471.1 hypothetical protein M758_3G022500 [Ceratodon purpureus]
MKFDLEELVASASPMVLSILIGYSIPTMHPQRLTCICISRCDICLRLFPSCFTDCSVRIDIFRTLTHRSGLHILKTTTISTASMMLCGLFIG